MTSVFARHVRGGGQDQFRRQRSAVSWIDHDISFRCGTEWPLRRIGSHIGHRLENMVSCYRACFRHLLSPRETIDITKESGIHRAAAAGGLTVQAWKNPVFASNSVICMIKPSSG